MLINPNSTKLGRTLLSFAGTLHSEPVLMQTFIDSDSFANKATGTLTRDRYKVPILFLVSFFRCAAIHR